MTYRLRTKTLPMAAFALLSGSLALAQAGSMGSSPNGQPPNAGAPGTMGSPQTPQNIGAGAQAGMDSANMNAPMDKEFVFKALQGGMFEVASGKLALDKSSNPEVKQFAQRMIDDHSRLGDQMKPIAEQLSVQMPSGLSKKDKALMAKFQGLSGEAFDKAYIEAMVKDHRHDEADFKQEASSATIPAVRDAATQATPIITSHREQIEQIAKSNNVTVSGKGGN